MRGVPAIDRGIFEPSIGDQHRGVRNVLHVPGELLRVRRHGRPIYLQLGVRRVTGGLFFHKERIRDTDRERCERHVRLPCRLLPGQHRSQLLRMCPWNDKRRRASDGVLQRTGIVVHHESVPEGRCVCGMPELY